MPPKLRGIFQLASADPSELLLKDPNGYAAEVDRVSICDGARHMLRFMFDNLEGKGVVQDRVPPNSCSKLTLSSSDEEIDRQVRQVG